MNFRDIAIGVVVVAAGLGVGFGLGKGGRTDVVSEAGDAGSSATRMVSALSPKGGRASAFAKVSRDPGARGMHRLLAQLALVEGADADEIPGLLEEVRREATDGAGREMLLGVLAKRWAEVDPERALEAMLVRRPPEVARFHREVIEQVAQEDRDGCWTMLVDGRHRRDGQAFLRLYLHGLADWDPDLAMARAAELDVVADHMLLAGFLEEIAGEEPLRVLAFTEDRPGVMGGGTRTGYPGGIETSMLGQSQLSTYRRVARQWSQHEPEMALRWYDGLEGDEREAVLPPLLEGWAATEPEAAITYAFANLAAEGQEAVFEDAVGAMAWAREIGDPSLMDEVMGVLGAEE